jgi:hypothetical protein
MEEARKIREAVAQVGLLRRSIDVNPALGGAVGEVKRLQSRRFAGTYADLLAAGPYALAAQFFLEELYGDKDFAERDAQFARIAGAIERLLPEQVKETAVALAQLHAVTEELDQAMAAAWMIPASSTMSDPQRYVTAWREVGRRGDREGQLHAVIGIGREMARLTRTSGLRMMLRMMRRPAAAAGLGALQRFLETGFDTFAALARREETVEDFLHTIEGREAALMRMLFDTDLVTCETELARILGQAP